MKFLTYLASWDPNYVNVLSYQPITNNTIIMIAYASFEFDALGTIGGMFLTKKDLQEIIKEIKSKGGTVLLSFGGPEDNYFVSQSNKWPDTNAIASSIVTIIEDYGFNGCDLNIQESYDTNIFATQILTIIQNIRKSLPSTMITLTIPGQKWNTYYQSLVVRAYSYLDIINFMEYNIWINFDYTTQIKADIGDYISIWLIPADKISLGLLPGLDKVDIQARNMTLEMTTSLATWAKAQKLQGIMIWDSNKDYSGIDNNISFAYTKAVQSIIE